MKNLFCVVNRFYNRLLSDDDKTIILKKTALAYFPKNYNLTQKIFQVVCFRVIIIFLYDFGNLFVYLENKLQLTHCITAVNYVIKFAFHEKLVDEIDFVHLYNISDFGTGCLMSLYPSKTTKQQPTTIFRPGVLTIAKLQFFLFTIMEIMKNSNSDSKYHSL